MFTQLEEYAFKSEYEIFYLSYQFDLLYKWKQCIMQLAVDMETA